MTNPTPHGQVTAIQRYKIGYHADEWGQRSSTPSGIPDASGSWVRYEDHAAELRRLHAYCQELESHLILDCMTHVQNPAEIEHVAGDVSKNGAELNMSAQQPAPASQQEAQEPVAWQSRTRPTWEGNTSPWSPWKPCTKEQAEDYWKTPLLNDWAHEARALYTAPQPTTAPLSEDLRDRLVAISGAIADQDDRAAQAMLREILEAPQPSPAAQGDALSDDAVRVPLDKLHADAAYLIGRLREGSMPYARVIEIIRERIDAAKAAIRARAAQGDALDAVRLDWLTFNLSGKALRDIGVVWSEHGDARRAIDDARKEMS